MDCTQGLLCCHGSCISFVSGLQRVSNRGCIAVQGQRALDFVLRNQGLIDKTLLFDIELVKVS